MRAARIGLALRLLGPALEILCIGLLLRGFGRDRSVFGLDLEPLLYAGLALGLAMVALGLGMSIPRGRVSRAARRRDDPRQ